MIDNFFISNIDDADTVPMFSLTDDDVVSDRGYLLCALGFQTFSY